MRPRFYILAHAVNPEQSSKPSATSAVLWLGWLTLAASTLILSLARLPEWQRAHINGDEAGVLWVWNHSFLSRNYFCAVASQIMAPPMDFVAGGAWWRLLEHLFPAWTNLNLEWAARSYPWMLMTCATFFLGTSLFLITDSWVLALALLIVFTKASPLVNLYFAEVRFYPAMYLFTILSWLFYLRAEKTLRTPEIRTRGVLTFLTVGAIGVWFHIYVLFTVAGLSVILTFELYRQHQVSPLLKDRVTRVWLLGILGSYLFLFYYLARYANKPHDLGLRHLFDLPLREWWPLWRSTATEVFGVSVPRLFQLLFIFLVVNLFSSDRSRTARYAIVAAGALAASVLIMLSQGQMHYNWGGRYILFILPNIVILLGYLLKGTYNVLSRAWSEENPPVRVWALLQWIAIPGIAVFLLWGQRISAPHPGDTWVVSRKRIVQNHLNVVGVLGIHPSEDHSLTQLENGNWVGMSWELYANGIHQ